jgi:hypothetical protein
MSGTFAVGKDANLKTMDFGKLRGVSRSASFERRNADLAVSRNAASLIHAVRAWLLAGATAVCVLELLDD